MGTRVNGVNLSAGTSVTISTATPQPLGTAAAGSTGEASDAGHVHALPAIPSATSGTLAARPVSPAAGDIYAVTSGTGAGDVYECAVAGSWRLIAYTRMPAIPSAVARWLLTDTTSTIDDSVGANDLAFSGASTRQSRPSPWGTSLYCGNLAAGDGPKGATAITPAAITLSAWVRTHAYASTTPYLVAKRQSDATWSGGSPTNMAFGIYNLADGSVGGFAFTAGGNPNAVTSGSDRRLPLDVWCHLAVSYSTTDGLRLYIDGQLAGTAAAAGAITWGTGSWTIGANNSGSGVAFAQFFDGFIRDVQVSETVLTAAQVLEIYTRGVGTYAGQP